LSRIATADATDVLRGLGFTRVKAQGIRAITPVAGSLAGQARTLRWLPDREDLKGPVNGPVNRGLYESMQAGQVVVIDAMGVTSAAVIGDMIYSMIRARGAAGVVVDGAVRDTAFAAREGFPLFATTTASGSYMGSLRPWENDVPIQCGGVLVLPGDWILADTDGVVIVPAAVAPSVADKAEAKAISDRFSQALLAAGFAMDDAYPLGAHMEIFLPAFLNDGALPSSEAVARERNSLIT
jgi:regulator of RNase E activity RraA